MLSSCSLSCRSGSDEPLRRMYANSTLTSRCRLRRMDQQARNTLGPGAGSCDHERGLAAGQTLSSDGSLRLREVRARVGRKRSMATRMCTLVLGVLYLVIGI